MGEPCGSPRRLPLRPDGVIPPFFQGRIRARGESHGNVIIAGSAAGGIGFEPRIPRLWLIVWSGVDLMAVGHGEA